MNNPLYPLLRSAKNSSITTRALELAEGINSQMVELRELGRPKSYREKEFQKRRTEMAKAIFDLVETESNRLQAAIDGDAKKWREASDKRIHARTANQELARTHYQAISLEALERELEEISSADFIDRDPEVVEAALGVARARGVDSSVVDAHYQLLNEKNYQARWLQSPEAAQIQKEIKFYSSQGRQPYTVPIISPGGETTAIDFSDLLDGSGGEGRE